MSQDWTIFCWHFVFFSAAADGRLRAEAISIQTNFYAWTTRTSWSPFPSATHTIPSPTPFSSSFFSNRVNGGGRAPSPPSLNKWMWGWWWQSKSDCKRWSHEHECACNYQHHDANSEWWVWWKDEWFVTCAMEGLGGEPAPCCRPGARLPSGEKPRQPS